MCYESRDRATIADMGFRPETLAAWKQQGLPDWVYWRDYDDNSTNRFFGMDSYRSYIGVNFGLTPEFEEQMIEDRGDKELVRQCDGVSVLRHKFMSSIPYAESHLLTDRESWTKHYKPRLDPEHPDRYPADWDRSVEIWKDTQRDSPVVVRGGSLYGWLRNWMGMEQLSLLVYDDPALFEEMVDTIAECVLGVLTKVFSTKILFDACYLWEDMCFKTAPMLGPKQVNKYLVPRYRRITALCRKNGVKVVCLDCDGSIEELIPLWLEGGINCLYPIEIGAPANDPIALRNRFGRDLRMMGGFSKAILADSKEAIAREIQRLEPLVHEGGYIGFCDHHVPPDVSLENYMFYCQTVRKIWYDNVKLKPLDSEEHLQ